jgi:thioredoxin 1
MCHSHQPGIAQRNCIASVVTTLALISVGGCAEHVVVDPDSEINGMAERLTVDESSTVTHETVDFNDAVADAETSGKTLIVDFGATWCGPCRMLKPEMEKVSAQARGQVIVLTVDVDTQHDLAAHFQVGAIPDIRFFQHGKAAGGVVGFHTADQIIAKIPSP